MDRAAVLSIAYHNMGVELEYLKRFDESIRTYEKAVNFAKKNIGVDNQIVINFQKVLNQAKQQVIQNKFS